MDIVDCKFSGAAQDGKLSVGVLMHLYPDANIVITISVRGYLKNQAVEPDAVIIAYCDEASSLYREREVGVFGERPYEML